MRFVKNEKISKLSPYKGNARLHSDRDIEAVKKSVEKFGWTNPILAQEKTGRVIAGHGRLLAAARAGLLEVPVVYLELTDVEASAYTIADNQIATLSEWDPDLLDIELANLQHQGFDCNVLGFDEDFMEGVRDKEGSSLVGDPEHVPEAPADPRTKLGDVWELGEHRLMCGDSTSAEDVGRLLGGQTPFIMVTDPPYGVNYDPVWRNNGKGYGRTGLVLNDDRADWRDAYRLFLGRVAYVWHASKFSGEVANGLESCGILVRQQIIWVKPRLVLSRGAYHFRHEPCWYAVRQEPEPQWTGVYAPEHEPCWYAVRKGSTAEYCDDRTQTTVWEIGSSAGAGNVEDANTNHSTQKPLECMARPIRNHGTKNDAVYDPFCGSGTTLIAAEMLHRQCFAMELSPAYCDVIVERWENVTKKQAKKTR